MKAVCEIYQAAPALYKEGVHVISIDEKPGIQALQSKAPLQRMEAGQVERREFEYIRHGTLCLTANFEVATGQVVTPTIEPTRTEEQFAAHIQRLLDTDPEGEWIFITDHLNTHLSESLVRLVAERCKTSDELGRKGKSGILQSKATRETFLEEKNHRIRWIYTPKHCSWLNQIEIWFSILTRRLLKRASFASLEELERRLRQFIDYFNRTMAKPFKWTYAGKPLQA